MTVSIDQDGCISCGLCAQTCSDVFRMADDGKAEVHHDPTSNQEDSTQEAANGCPVSVISVTN